jgi:hypothetical protein
VWDENFPTVISGHIHASFTLQKNIHYSGSARQVAIDEDPEKRIWLVTFAEGKKMTIKKIDLKLKARKEMEITYDDIENFDFSLAQRYYIKLRVKGTSDQFKVLRKGELYKKLVDAGVTVAFDPILADRIMPTDLKVAGKEEVSFDGILKYLVKKRSKCVREAYNDVINTLGNV